MKTSKEQHLDEKKILLAIVDEDLMGEQGRVHLSSCPHCLEWKKETEKTFSRLGETAKQNVPSPKKHPKLPSMMGVSSWKSIFLRPALATAMTLFLVIGTWWVTDLKTPAQNGLSTNPNARTLEDEQLMKEVEMFSDSGLPKEYMAMIPGSESDPDGELMEDTAPLKDGPPVSLNRRKKGGTPC
jgi:hypothetical protein